MEQKKYKILFFRLSVVVLAMMAMLMAAVSIGQNMLFEKTDDETEFSRANERNLTFTFNRNFDIIDESALIFQPEISGPFRKNMIFRLKIQLDKNATNLYQFENNILTFSFSRPPQQSEYFQKNNKNIFCDKDWQAVPEHCDGQCARDEGSNETSQGGKESKRPVETFYWI